MIEQRNRERLDWPAEWSIVEAEERLQRTRAWRLAYDVFHKVGYESHRAAKVRVLLQDALPEARTFAIEADPIRDAPLATLSLIPDSPLRLPIDSECPEEVAALRTEGRKVCEVAKLAAEAANICPSAKRALVFYLFRRAWREALQLGATDLLISVVPRHARFYQHVLLFEPLGGPRPYRTVGGTVGIPMRLDLSTAEERYRSRYGTGETGSLYTFFTQADTASPCPRNPYSPEDLRYFFVERSDVFACANAEERAYLATRHAGLDWAEILRPAGLFAAEGNRAAG